MGLRDEVQIRLLLEHDFLYDLVGGEKRRWKNRQERGKEIQEKESQKSKVVLRAALPLPSFLFVREALQSNLKHTQTN